MNDMTLTRLNVWARHDGLFTCSASFEGPRGKVELELQPELGGKIVDLCLSDIVESIQSSAAQAVRELSAPRPKVLEHGEDA